MSTEDLPEFHFATLEQWYLELLSPTVERRLDASGTGTLTWCPQWWQHPEVISRLEALWRAWEVCRAADGEAPSRWYWQHLDPMMAVLTDAKTGPMSACKPAQHYKYNSTQHLPAEQAPTGHWGAFATG